MPHQMIGAERRDSDDTVVVTPSVFDLAAPADLAPTRIESDVPVGSDVRGQLGELAEQSAVVRPVRRDHITCVLVCHDGARWLPTVLTALAGSGRQPHTVVAVDCGSTDATATLLATATREGVVDSNVTLPRGTAFGAAVAAGVAAAEPATDVWPVQEQWVWLLHDDCAPDAAALEELLHASDDQPSVAIVGPKVRGWHDRRLLLECGVTVARGGARVTGLERREHDQGQRDGLRDVLAVGSAGMLVRRDAWDRLEGFDPGLAMFRDDIDLCWRARRAGYRVVVTGAAVVHHREAGAHGHRADPEERRSPQRRDRASAIHLMLAHTSRLGLVPVFLRLVLSSLLRAAGYLLGKSPREARDEVGALLDALRHPRSLWASRALVRRAGAGPGSVPERDVRALLAPRSGQARLLVEQASGFLAYGDASSTSSAMDAQSEDADPWLTVQGPSRLRRWATRPGALLTLGLLALTTAAVRALLGSGTLQGGALAPAPLGAGDLLGAYLAGWHDVGLGSSAAAPPWLALLALPAALLRGQAPLAVDVLVLFAVPLAGLAAYSSLRGLVASPWVRCWAAVTYALLPAVTGAVGAGRLGTCVVAVLLPPLARSGARLLGAGRSPTWRRAWGTGLLLAVVAAFVPAVWLVAAVLAVVGGVLVGGVAARLRLLVAVLVPAALLGPWLLRLVREPGMFLLEPGLNGPTDPALTGRALLLLHPGGPGATPLVWMVPLLLAAVVALLRRDRWRVVLPAWLTALVALVLGLLQLRAQVLVPGVVLPVQPWPGPATLIAGGALLLAIAVAADELRRRFTTWSFGWRQPAVLLLAVAALVAPVGSALAWGAGVDGPLNRGDAEVVPAFVAADLAAPARPRVLVVALAGDHVQYELLNSATPLLGERDMAAVPAAAISRAVGALVAGVGGSEVDELGAWAVKYVVLQGDGARDQRVARRLDGQSGLRRVAGDSATALWRVAPVVPRVQAVPAAPVGGPGTVAVGSGLPVRPGAGLVVDAAVPPAARPGRLVLAQTPDSGWVARDGGPDGTALPVLPANEATAGGRWQGELAASTSHVVLSHQDPARSRALWIQLIVLGIVLVLALPARRRPADDLDAGDPESEAVPS